LRPGFFVAFLSFLELLLRLSLCFISVVFICGRYSDWDMTNKGGSKMKTQVIVIYGGRSAEHEVSLISALTVINAIDRNDFECIGIYITREGAWCNLGKLEGIVASPADLQREPEEKYVSSSMGSVMAQVFGSSTPKVIFPVIHGTNGEDGTLQGLLEMLQVPYVGNGVLASAAGMDKEMTKRVMWEAGIPQADYVSFRIAQWEKNPRACLDEIEFKIGFPCYVKPANSGSSIGIHRCSDPSELMEAFEQAFRYDQCIVVEEEIVGREVQVAIMGNETPMCSITGEFVRKPSFFPYAQKYLQGSLVQRIPAHISDEVYERIRSLAIHAFQKLNGSGLMRVDFFVTDHDEVYFNEVNTLPGFTANSMFPVLWNRTNGMTYPQMIRRLIRYALERHVRKQSICYDREPELVQQEGASHDR
jgi:D-alanine-D-alanine ligase